MTFGTGTPLVHSNRFLRNPAERRRRILDVAERNSIIEGLPPFTKAVRERLQRTLSKLSSPQRVRRG